MLRPACLLPAARLSPPHGLLTPRSGQEVSLNDLGPATRRSDAYRDGTSHPLDMRSMPLHRAGATACARRAAAAGPAAPCRRPAPGREQHGLAHEAGDEFAVRVFVQLLRRAGLRDQAGVHHDDLVAHGQRLALVVGDVGHRQLQALLQAADLLAHLRRSRASRLDSGSSNSITAGLQHQRARHRHALLLAARQFAGQALVVAGQAHAVHRGAGAARGLVRGHAGDRQAVATLSSTFMCGNSA
jgi:hypothetical protein